MSLPVSLGSELKPCALPEQSRQELEQHSVDTASTSDAVTFITYVQSLKRKIKQFEKQVEVSARCSCSSPHLPGSPTALRAACLGFSPPRPPVTARRARRVPVPASWAAGF